MISYIQTLNTIRVAIKNNKKYVYLNNSKKVLAILTCLMQTNLILGYCLITNSNSKNFNKKLCIYINTKLTNTPLTTISSVTKITTIKLKEIKKLKNLTTASYYILITSKGITSLNGALEKNVGGIILSKVN